ncbi:MAG: CPBP family intramembrane metalloprotease [Lachnospiraceae bacterium]|nr:CPBP family intramembrane metalloprotease [Lachnospiraceae bacterium]
MKLKWKYFLFSILAFAIAFATMQLAGIVLRALRSNGVMQGGMNSTNVNMLVQIVICVVLIILLGLIWFRRSAIFPPKNTDSNDSLPKRIPRKIISILVLGLSLHYFLVLIISVLAFVMPNYFQGYVSFFTDATSDGAEWIVILYTVILGPVLEELVFRGLVFGYARKVFPVWFAIIFQAALFGIYHWDLVQGIYTFVLGLFLGYICLKGPGIRYSIPCHMMFNFTMDVLSNYMSNTLGNIYFILIIGIGVTIFFMWFLNSATKVKKKQA